MWVYNSIALFLLNALLFLCVSSLAVTLVTWELIKRGNMNRRIRQGGKRCHLVRVWQVDVRYCWQHILLWLASRHNCAGPRHDGIPEGQIYSSSTELPRGLWLTSRPGRFTPKNTPFTYSVWAWVGTRIGLDILDKGISVLPYRGFKPGRSSRRPGHETALLRLLLWLVNSVLRWLRNSRLILFRG